MTSFDAPDDLRMRGPSLTTWLIGLTVLLFIGWASVAWVEEIVRAPGQIVPSSRPQIIQNLEGGILAELNVAEGDVVEAGQTLARLQGTQYRAVMDEVTDQIAALDIRRVQPDACRVGEATAAELRATRARGGRIVAVGTTSVRALESMADATGGGIAAASGWTRKYVMPPYEFRAVDALITNFHLPRTTLLLLVAALSGEDLLRAAYAHAVRERYRFYSYGDAMLVV